MLQFNLEQKTLLGQFNCAENYPPEQYFENRPTTIIHSSIGDYREADGLSFSRFGYRFHIEHTNLPHRIIVHYPDDKRRFMCIEDGTCYDLTTSALTGFTQPLSNQMIEMEIIYWPRWNDCSIIFMTYGEGEPAAIADIAIYELNDIEEDPISNLDEGLEHREFGIQYEDPCGTAASEGSISHAEWTEHMIRYMKHSGQRVLAYPMAWYHGPLFPSNTDLSDGMDMVVAKDSSRTQYARWISKPNDWYQPLLERFGEEHLEFYGVLTLLRLSSLMRQQNKNIQSIIRGKDTINNVLSNNRVRTSTGDWTAIYNAINYNTIFHHMKPHKKIPGFRMPFLHPNYVYGEHNHGVPHGGSIFNPLHPKVQQAIMAFVLDTIQRYAVYPAFKGLFFNMYSSDMLWFGSIHDGYDDFTVGLFEHETGIKIPIRPHAPRRFSQRYEYLMFHCRDAWINWRCDKIHDFIRKLRDSIISVRFDLQMTLTLWDETVMPCIFKSINAAHQIFARKSSKEIFKEAGIDIDLYRNESNLTIDYGIGCTRDRGGHGKNPAGGITLTAEETSMYRDHTFLDSDSLNSVRALPNGNAFIFNCWVEAWGKHLWELCDPADPNIKEFKLIDGKEADGIIKINSEYPADGFWWDSQLRIIPGLLGGIHFMEPFVHAVAELDALRITSGGLFCDKGHTPQLQEFARNFIPLPRIKFLNVGNSTDPVVVRKITANGLCYFYFVNREYYPIQIRVQFSEDHFKITPLDALVNDREIEIEANVWETTLKPYELRSFTMDAGIDINNFNLVIPTEIIQLLETQSTECLTLLERTQAMGYFIPGMEKLREKMTMAYEHQEYAWLRRALTCYIVRRCQELEDSKI